jgi:hypothetical protein
VLAAGECSSSPPPLLEAVWLPYLRGSGTREQAMAALIEKTAVSR